MKKICILLVLLSVLYYVDGGKSNHFRFKKVKLPNFIRGFTLKQLVALKEKLGNVKWMKLKHLFILNPHLPFLLLAGKNVTEDDVNRWPPGIGPTEITEEEENAETEEQDESTNPLNLQNIFNPLNFSGHLSNALELGDHCNPGVCRLQLKNEDETLRDLCIHFATGFIGECSSENAIHICLPTQLLTCHPKVQLASTMIDAFLPKPIEPVVVIPEGKKISFQSLNEIAENVVLKLKEIPIEEIGQEVLVMFRNLAKNTTIFVEESIEKIQEYLEDNENIESLGLLTFHHYEEFEIENVLQIVQSRVLARINVQSRSKSIEEMDLSTQNSLTEITPREFKFNEDFMKNLDDKITSKSARKQRTFDSMEVMTEILELKKAIFSAKAAFFNMLTKYNEKEKMKHIQFKAVGSSSWPWYHATHQRIIPTCTCLQSEDLKIIDPDHQPCTQPIPWCIVSSDSKCPDMSLIKEKLNLDVFWSQQACANFKEYEGPKFYR